MKIETVGVPQGLVSGALFGGNALFHIDADANGFRQKLSDLGVTNIRWPGGSIIEGWFDPANPDVPLTTPRRVEQSLNPNNILTFTEVMNLAKLTGRAVDLVVPTLHVLKPADPNGYRAIDTNAVAEIRDFVAQALRPGGLYADAKIESIEIGNEYWASLTSKEYGRIVNVLAKAVQEGIEASGATYRPELLVQVGDAWGPDFEAGGAHHGKGLTWGETLARANQDIIDQLDGTSRLLIDGLIDHFYPRNRGEVSFDSSDAWSVKKKQSVWLENGMDLGLHLTEWNMNMHGLKEGQDVFASGVGMLETFEYMVRMGAQTAFVWPLTQSTSNDLTGKAAGESGHLSSNGAVFTLLSQNVRGLSWQELTLEDVPAVESSFYTGWNKAVLFLAADDGTSLNATLDLAAIVPQSRVPNGYLSVTQTKVVRDLAQDVWVGTGAGAAIVQGAASYIPSLAVSLKPYEVVMITLEWKTPTTIGAPAAATVTGTGGADRIHGGTLAQTITSLGGNDYIQAGGGDDTCWGGAGNDTLAGVDGNDLLWGEAGNDALYGGLGSDVLYGGADDDVLVGEAGDDTVIGGDGNDRLWGGSGNDLLNGQAGNDVQRGDEGNDRIVNDQGSDTVYGGVGNDTVTSGADGDLVFGEDGNDLLLGGLVNDVLDGGNGDDIINGQDGDDRLAGGFGNDTLIGGYGNDTMNGQAGNDVQRGESGNDFILNDQGSDTVYGGAGNDTITSGIDGDYVFGEDGSDRIVGGAGNDRLIGGTGFDALFGQDGDDLLRGGSDADTLDGGLGNDFLISGTGNDFAHGGAGNDLLYFGSTSAIEGGSGIDTVFGGPGQDQFLFSGTSGYTDIMDFQDGVDRLRFHGTDVDGMADLTLRSNSAGHVVVSYSGGTIRLNNVTLTDLSAADFIF